jgi:hypothetical protein
MRDDDVDRILSKEQEIIPSSGFVSSVMDAMQCEAAAAADSVSVEARPARGDRCRPRPRVGLRCKHLAVHPGNRNAAT